MKPRLTVMTIGVDDLERSVRLYRAGLDLSTAGIIGTEFEQGMVAFFDVEAGLKLALRPRKSLSHNSGVCFRQHELLRLYFFRCGTWLQWLMLRSNQ